MKISVNDNGSGITQAFAKAIGARMDGRFIYIPKTKGGGYITGFSWGKDIRMMLRHYFLKEEFVLERTYQPAEEEDNIVFLLSGIFSSPVQPEQPLSPEQAHVLICRQAVSSVMTMPSNTTFGSVTMAVSREYLRQLFGNIKHPVVESMLKARSNFVFETAISPEIIKAADGMLDPPVPESLERQYFKLKCEELLCYVFALLIQRDAVPASSMHIDDIKAIYAIKLHLETHLSEPPNIAALASGAKMSEPKLRKLFRQTFGKGVFEYYQTARMQEAARLLKDKRHSVADVGFQMGFTNLSHFSRVFEEHIGMKPKKYSSN